MDDKKRIAKVLDELREVWERNPELRLGQLLVNAAKAANHEDISKSSLFYIEDKRLLKGLSNLKKLGKV